MTTPVMFLADFYKLSHREQYPKNTQIVYSTLTPRSNKKSPHADRVVFFGLQYFIKEYLIDRFNKDFFDRPKKEVIDEYVRLVSASLGKTSVYTKHLEQLHDLGYLPIRIKALPEGSLVPMRVPCLTVENTIGDFFWITNFLETILLNTLWLPCTSATTAYSYYNLLKKYALETVGDLEQIQEFLPYQAHDFSMRGMSSEQSSRVSGASHLLSFKGSDTIPAGVFLEEYYNADIEQEKVFCSIPATEHSVMSAYGEENELEFLRHLLVEVYPTGAVSVVCDTWDFWRVISKYLPKLKNVITDRAGSLVIRPDSGDPIDILCGTVKEFGKGKTVEEKGLIESLWDIFGGYVNSKGYRCLDSHIGVIYGDGITLDICDNIMKHLTLKGFASNNIVLGVGTSSYQFTARDAFGWAMKATYAVIDGQERLLFKDPKTDSGVKKSQRGLVVVNKDSKGFYSFTDGLYRHDYEKLLDSDNLKLVYENGKLLQETSLTDIRSSLGTL